MKKTVKLLNKIAAVGTDELDREYYEVGADIDAPDAIMVRSAAMHDMEFDEKLLAIARCGAGVNNIPVERCSAEGIVVFNTPGANANAVKELTLCALLLASRRITAGVDWALTLKDDPNAAKTVEKGKSAFGGVEIQGKKLGVIGLGAIGGMVANAALNLGMEVMGCDPYLSVEAAWSLSREVRRAASYEEIFRECDYNAAHSVHPDDQEHHQCRGHRHDEGRRKADQSGTCGSGGCRGAQGGAGLGQARRICDRLPDPRGHRS